MRASEGLVEREGEFGRTREKLSVRKERRSTDG
jgi:hypothetical protein